MPTTKKKKKNTQQSWTEQMLSSLFFFLPESPQNNKVEHKRHESEIKDKLVSGVTYQQSCLGCLELDGQDHTVKLTTATGTSTAPVWLLIWSSIRSIRHVTIRQRTTGNIAEHWSKDDLSQGQRVAQ